MLPLTTILWRLLWSAFLGLAIGVERSARRRPAGMRTSLCICLGAALFTIISAEYAKLTGDTGATRIASNIVQGIGFLGAGVILRERGSVVGLTTAALIFVMAAMGMAAGAGFYKVSGLTCLIVLIVLSGLLVVEGRFDLKPRYMFFRISGKSAQDLVPEVHRIFDDLKIPLNSFQMSLTGDKPLLQFDADVSHRQQEKILSALAQPGVTCEMTPIERRVE